MQHKFHFRVCQNAKQKLGKEPMPRLTVTAESRKVAWKQARAMHPIGSIRDDGWESGKP